MADLPPVPARRRGHRRFDWRALWRKALVGVAALGLALAAIGTWLWHETPDATHVAELAAVTPSRIVSADGVLLDTIGTRQYTPVTLEEVSPHVVAALLATEDRRFHDHRGLDLRRIAGAVWSTLQGDVQGASTITQQLARNLFPRRIGHERSLLRKLREAVVALKIERAYDKRRILEMYLNQVPFLYNVTGIEMAAQTYFGKPAAQLRKHEAALLVAMLKGPRFYDPVRWPERAKARRDLVLALMSRDAPGSGGGFLRKAHAAAPPDGSEQPLGVKLQRRDLEPARAPHFVHQVRRQLAAWAEANDVELARDGLTIHTTLDTRLQELAEQAVQRQADFLQQMAERAWAAPRAKGATAETPFPALWRERPELLAELAQQTPAYRAARQAGASAEEALRRGLADRAALRKLQEDKTRLEAGFVVIDPRSGAVRAYVGSRDFAVDRYDHVASARRQPGSTFKPFVYGAALRAGVPPTREYIDEVPQIVLPDGRTWSPGDIGGASGEPVTLRDGLARSKNTITVQVMQQVGVEPVIRYARAMGIERAELAAVPSLALGTSPVTLLEMARAYATFAALGVKREPLLVSHIVGRDGIELARLSSQPQQVLDDEQARLLVDILRDAVNRGTGRLLRTKFALDGDLAGKTGTTQHNTDGWFIGMRPNLVAGAWVGFNDQRVTMRGNAWGTGGHSALLIVGDFLREGAKAGRIDMRERFPAPPPPPPPEEPAWPHSPEEPPLPATFDSAPSLEALVPPREQPPEPLVVAASPGGDELPPGITWSRPPRPPAAVPPTPPEAVTPAARRMPLPEQRVVPVPEPRVGPPPELRVVPSPEPRVVLPPQPRVVAPPEQRSLPPPRRHGDEDDLDDDGRAYDDAEDEVPVIRPPRRPAAYGG